jgi:hypothetical protein
MSNFAAMKKIVLLLLAVLISAAASTAQVVESRMGGVYVEKGPSPENRWFIKLGGGLATQDFDVTPWFVNNASDGSGTALDLSFGFNRDFKHGSSWYWGFKLGATYTMMTQEFDKGESFERDEYDGYEYSYTYAWNSVSCDINRINLHIGPTFGFRKSLGSNVKLDINFTPEFVWRENTNGENHMELDYTYTYVEKGPNNYQNVDTEEDHTHLCFNEYNNYLASATLGVDLWIKKFIVGVNYRYVFDFDYIKGGPQTVMFNIGLAF